METAARQTPSPLLHAGLRYVPSYWVVIPDQGKPELIAFELHDGRYAEAARASGGEPFAAARPFAVEVVPARLVAGLAPPA